MQYGTRAKFPFIDLFVEKYRNKKTKLIKIDPVFDLNSNSPHVLFTGKRQRLQRPHVRPLYKTYPPENIIIIIMVFCRWG